MKRKLLFNILAIVLLSGCASPDKAIFVTSTSMSLLEGDSKPAGVSIGYKRVEGYLGPNNADGTAPPIIASIQSDGEIWNPKIRQLYATGLAATVASSDEKCKKINNRSGKDKKLMFFGTSTNTGLSIGTTSDIPDSFVFGYKRKEFSLIPLVKINNDNYSYPSVLASIDTTGELDDSSSNVNTALKTNQFFATGDAACNLAEKLGSEFVERAKVSVDVQQRNIAAQAINCYAGLRLKDRVAVWNDAHFNKLFHEEGSEIGNTFATIKAAYSEAVKDGKVIDADRLFRADRVYTGSVFLPSIDNVERLSKLTEHRGYVCGLARANKPD
ncbi:hypothetical protein [Vibrio sp. RE88]|uniref:hypothetical protein n=1 Tax=Vibrio sp. RE88 TaxID=2607610 RepID=UPI0014934BAA|nr:hypothetical protein [Vibrio sp. RE88]NOH60572.1 hypothetical protein [Vibrio sp. RE88]